MKIHCTLAGLFLGLSLSFAQENKLDYPDLKNPKILEIQTVFNGEELNYEGLKKQYDAIFKGSNLEDKVHLFIFDLSNPKGEFVNYRLDYSDQVQPIVSAIIELPESDFKNFAIALVYKKRADFSYQEPEEKTDYLNKSFHGLLDLISKGDERSLIPLAKVASELYVLGFEDKHLTEELILDLYSDYMAISASDRQLIDYLLNGLYYENAYQVQLSDAEKQAKGRYKDIVSKIIKRCLTDFPDSSPYFMYQLWSTHLTNFSSTSLNIRYIPEVGNSISLLIEDLKDDTTFDYIQVKPMDFLFHYFLDEDTNLDIQGYIQLFNSKKDAYEFLVLYLNELSENEYMPLDLLTQKPKWVQVFKNEIEQDINKVFPFVVRYSNEHELVFLDKNLEPSTIKKSVENFDKIKSFLYNDDIKAGYTLLRMYEYGKFMSEVTAQKKYKNNSELKWEQARMLLDFEYSYLLTKTIHSPTILGISSAFDNWTPTEVEKYKKDINDKLFDYLESYETVSGLTLEGEIVKDELKKVAIKFDLL